MIILNDSCLDEIFPKGTNYPTMFTSSQLLRREQRVGRVENCVISPIYSRSIETVIMHKLGSFEHPFGIFHVEGYF